MRKERLVTGGGRKGRWRKETGKNMGGEKDWQNGSTLETGYILWVFMQAWVER